jgi:hypothetical protein
MLEFHKVVRRRLRANDQRGSAVAGGYFEGDI